MQQWQKQLDTGLAQMGLDLPSGVRQQLLDYLALLVKWNRAFNLTAIRDPGEMVSRQLLDSLSILPLIQGNHLLDVGTGAGLPGIPLSLANQQLEATLVDSNGKKTRFVQQAIAELGLLGRTRVEQARIEQCPADRLYDTITCRAFADLPKIWKLAGHLLAPGGLLLAMKGQLPVEEMRQLEHQGLQVSSQALQVPGCDGERHAVLVRASA